MSMLNGVVRYEYRMAITRLGVWAAFAVAGGLFSFGMVHAVAMESPKAGSWRMAGQAAMMLNLWLPVVAGISLADRLPRDRALAVDELLASTSVTRRAQVLGKYFGGLLAVLTPVALVFLLMMVAAVASGAPSELLLYWVPAFVLVNVPAYAFLAAFSIACPAVMPVRVYQVLFTGYWFWGNFLNPQAMPTLNGTLLTPSGAFAARAFFGSVWGPPGVGAGTVVLNLAVLGACAAAALVAVERYLTWRDRRA